MSDELFFWQREQEDQQREREDQQREREDQQREQEDQQRERGDERQHERGDERESRPPAIDTALRDHLQLCLLPGLGPRSLSGLMESFESAGAVLRAATGALQRVAGVGPKLAHTIRTAADHVDVDGVLDWCHRNGVQILQPGGEGYPTSLSELDDPPPVLFSRGRLTHADGLAVAVVGTRHATPYGLQQTRRLARDLANASVTIVSGLARGIDTAAHRAALEVGGRTIAFLGGGLGHMYPRENAPLADQIAACGAVISEYAPLAKPRGGMFPQRNRLIAATALATLVIEAPEHSGALITARLASELGRGVGVLPGPVHSRASRGCHHLIRDGGTLVTDAEDVLELLGPLSLPICRSPATPSDRADAEMRNGREITLNELELAVLQQISPTGSSLDEVTVGCEMPSARVAAIVSVLEMKRLVRRLSSQYVARV